LNGPEFVGSEPIDRGTWIALQAYCCTVENAGVIKDCLSWSSRKWQQLAAVTHEEAHRECDLWRWEGDDLVVLGYDQHGEDRVHQLRESGKRGGQKSGETRANRAAEKHINQAFQPEALTECLNQQLETTGSVLDEAVDRTSTQPTMPTEPPQQKEKPKEKQTAKRSVLMIEFGIRPPIHTLPIREIITDNETEQVWIDKRGQKWERVLGDKPKAVA